MDKIYVFGHKKPDTDSVTSAIAYAKLKNMLGFKCEPRVLGDINNETKYVLKHFKVNMPKYLNDVKVQIKDLNYRKGCFIESNESIYNVYKYMMSRFISSVPISIEGYFDGVLSMKDITTDYINTKEKKLTSTYQHTIEVLNGTEVLKFNDKFSYDIIAPFKVSETFLKETKMDTSTCLIVGDRTNIIENAINNHIGLIILIDNIDLKKSLIDLAKKNRINIIKTEKNYFEVIKLINFANSIDTISYEKSIVCFKEEMTVDDALDALKINHHNYYPIVDEENKCLGLLKVSDLDEKTPKKVILVDHNEELQSVDGLNEAEIIEIIDHHKIGTIGTDRPMNFRNRTVGSTNTIIYTLYKEHNAQIDKDIAGIMASGIISDTLLLKSPTTTPLDVKALNELSVIAGMDYESFGLKMFKNGSVFSGKTKEEIFFQDFKSFEIEDKKVGVSQVLTTDIDSFINQKKDYLVLIEDTCFDKNYNVLAMFVTDIIGECSYIFYNKASQNIFDYCFGECYEGKKLEGFVSRKKQIIPLIMKALGHR